jgi:hypothetical protein
MLNLTLYEPERKLARTFVSPNFISDYFYMIWKDGPLNKKIEFQARDTGITEA